MLIAMQLHAEYSSPFCSLVIAYHESAKSSRAENIVILLLFYAALWYLKKKGKKRFYGKE